MYHVRLYFNILTLSIVLFKKHTGQILIHQNYLNWHTTDTHGNNMPSWLSKYVVSNFDVVLKMLSNSKNHKIVSSGFSLFTIAPLP